MRLSALSVPMRLLALAGLAGLSACSGGDDAVEPAPEPPVPVSQFVPIAFSGTLPEERAVTRAVGLEDKETSFKAWAYKVDDTGVVQNVMPGFTVNWISNSAHTTTSNTDDWEYVGQGANQDIKYWDLQAQSYRFFGVAPASAPASFSSSGSPATSASVSLSVATTSDAGVVYEQSAIDAAPYFSEMWHTADVASVHTQPVTLTFVKPFCRVRYLFTFVDETMTRADIESQTFHPTAGTIIPRKGDVTITYPLTGTSSRETYAVANTDNEFKLTALTQDYYESADDTDTNKERWYTIVPPTSQGSYTLTIVLGGETKSVVVPEQYMQWKPGFEYTYIFKVTEGGAIVVQAIQVGINSWVEKKTIDHTIYNW